MASQALPVCGITTGGPGEYTVHFKPENLDAPYAQQNPEEFAWWLDIINGAKSILEIGSCYGHSLRMMAKVAAPGAKVRSIDLGRGVGKIDGQDTGASLLRTIADLRDQGFDAQCLLSDSRSAVAYEWAEKHGPYDAVFIDGDHSYEGASSDWDNYGLLGRIVGLHDIAYEGHEVKKLWAEIKRCRSTDELVRSRMGIGVVFRDAA